MNVKIHQPSIRTQLERLHRESYGWARHCCGDHPEEADDVLQAAYLKVLEGTARYKGKASFKTWFFAVIRNTAAEARRHRGSLRLRLVHPATLSKITADDTPHDSLDQSRRLALFRQALATLSERQREVLYLVMYYDFTLEEAARVMGVSLGSARTHYDRGKKRLRQRLETTGLFDATEPQR